MARARRRPAAPTANRGPAYWLAQQRAFMAERGTTLDGYIAHYQALADKHGAPLDVAQITDIHAADVAQLRRAEEAACPHPRRRIDA